MLIAELNFQVIDEFAVAAEAEVAGFDDPSVDGADAHLMNLFALEAVEGVILDPVFPVPTVARVAHGFEPGMPLGDDPRRLPEFPFEEMKGRNFRRQGRIKGEVLGVQGQDLEDRVRVVGEDGKKPLARRCLGLEEAGGAGAGPAGGEDFRPEVFEAKDRNVRDREGLSVLRFDGFHKITSRARSIRPTTKSGGYRPSMSMRRRQTNCGR